MGPLCGRHRSLRPRPRLRRATKRRRSAPSRPRSRPLPPRPPSRKLQQISRASRLPAQPPRRLSAAAARPAAVHPTENRPAAAHAAPPAAPPARAALPVEPPSAVRIWPRDTCSCGTCPRRTCRRSDRIGHCGAGHQSPRRAGGTPDQARGYQRRAAPPRACGEPGQSPGDVPARADLRPADAAQLERPGPEAGPGSRPAPSTPRRRRTELRDGASRWPRPSAERTNAK